MLNAHFVNNIPLIQRPSFGFIGFYAGLLFSQRHLNLCGVIINLTGMPFAYFLEGGERYGKREGLREGGSERMCGSTPDTVLCITSILLSFCWKII